jgi:hypothetical protein
MILEEIEECLEFGATISEISEETGIRYDDVKSAIKIMKADHKVFIVDWERDKDSIVFHPVYSLGHGVDMPLPVVGKPKRDVTVKMLFGDSNVE